MRQDKNTLVSIIVMAVALLLLLGGGLVWFLLYVEPMAGP